MIEAIIEKLDRVWQVIVAILLYAICIILVPTKNIIVHFGFILLILYPIIIYGYIIYKLVYEDDKNDRA